MAYKAFELTVENGLARLVLNKPDVGNPFDTDFCNEISEVGCDLLAMDDLRAVLVTARGRFFSVGADIRMFVPVLDTLHDGINRWTAGLHMGMARLGRLNAPIIGAVHSTAMGGSVAMLSNFDLVLAGKSAKFGAAYPQIGYSMDAGASFGLASRMGVARARRFLLLNEMLTAEQAHQTGLVDMLCEDDALEAEAEAVAQRLASGPTQAFGAIRRLMRKSLSQSFEAQLEDEARELVDCAKSADAREGITAFAEKRKAEFRGN